MFLASSWKLKLSKNEKESRTQFIVKLSQAYSSISTIQLHIAIAQGTSKIRCHLAQIKWKLRIGTLMTETVTLSRARDRTNKTGKLSSLSQKILCSKTSHLSDKQEGMSHSRSYSICILSDFCFHIASFPLDTKQQILIQYHPAVCFKWNLQHIKTCQELVIKNTTKSSTSNRYRSLGN